MRQGGKMQVRRTNKKGLFVATPSSVPQTNQGITISSTRRQKVLRFESGICGGAG